MRKRLGERVIEFAEDRAEPAKKWRAAAGWRAVWYADAVLPEGASELAPMLDIGVTAITWWGLEAPYIRLGDPSEWCPTGAVMVPGSGPVPLFGEFGEYFQDDIQFYAILDPGDRRSDEDLVAECSKWIAGHVTGGPFPTRERYRR